MSSQKISFGFSKLSKKTNVVSTNNGSNKKTVDYIDCLEGQAIKIKDAVEEVKKPLVIPMKDTANNLIDRIEETRKKNKLKPINEIIDDRPDSELTLDELAARQLLKEAKNITKDSSASEILTLPNIDKFVAEGKEESTFDDYQSVPIEQYGLAMLRGMGWSESKGIGKHEKITKVVAPELRAKGMGLGADKMVNTVKSDVNVDKDGIELALVKGAFAKIIAGQNKMNYCEVLGLDDESGRIIVRTALKGNILTLNEFLLVPVTKDEYTKSSKVINNVKYQEYKEKPSSTQDDKNIKTEKENLSRNVKEDAQYESGNLDKEKKSKKSKKSKKDKRSSSRSKSKYEDKKTLRHSRQYSSSDSEYERRSRSAEKSGGSKSKHSSSSSSKYHRKYSRDRNYSNSSSEERYEYKKK